MPYDRPFRVRPGAQPDPAEATQLSQQFNRADQVRANAAGGLSFVRGGDGVQVRDLRIPGHWAILGAGAGNAYAHAQAVPDGAGGFTSAGSSEFSIFGTPSVQPAWEANGRDDVPAGTVVWLEVVEGGWEFSYVGAGVPPANSSSGSSGSVTVVSDTTCDGTLLVTRQTLSGYVTIGGRRYPITLSLG